MGTLIGILVFGFLAGLLARAIMPGDQNMGCFTTSILGVIGAVLGGFVGALIKGDVDFHKLIEFDSATKFELIPLVSAIVGALAVLFIYSKIKK